MDATPTITREAPSRLPPFPRIAQVTILIMESVRPRLGRPTVRRGRLAVWSTVIIFLLLQAGLNFAIRSEALPVRDPVFTEKVELYRAWAGTHPGSSRVVALGSSRTQLAFDAERFGNRSQTSAFNYGCSAAGPLTCSLYWRRILAEPEPKPTHLFVEIHPGFLSPIDPPFESRWLHGYRLRSNEVSILRQHGWDAPVPAQLGWQGWCGSAYYFRMALLNRYTPKLLPCPYGLTVGLRSDAFGYVGGIDLPESDRPQALQRTFEQYAAAFPGYDVGGAGPKAIRDILEQAANQNIRASIVLMPESSEFRSWYGEQGYLAITRFGDSMAQEFGVPVYDAREWLDDQLIADGHHLSTEGARVFTDRLAQEASEWLRSSP